MSYLYGLGDPLPDTQWGLITEPQKTGEWSPEHQRTFASTTATMFDQYFQTAGGELVPIPEPVDIVRISNSEFVNIYADQWPYQDSNLFWINNDHRIVFARFIRPLLGMYLEWIEPVSEGFLLSVTDITVKFGRSFFQFVRNVIRKDGRLAMYLNLEKEIPDDAAAERLLNTKFTNAVLDQEEHLDLSLPNPKFEPIFIKRAETLDAQETIDRGTPISLQVEHRNIQNNQRIENPFVTWKIQSLDPFVSLPQQQDGIKLFFVPSTSLVVTALGGNFETSARRTILVQDLCIRCRKHFIRGLSGDYDCKWRLPFHVLDKSHKDGLWIEFQGRHSSDTLYPDGLGDMKEPNTDIWRSAGSLLVGGTGEIRQNQIIVRDEFERIIHGGERQIQDVPQLIQDVDGKYQAHGDNADYLMSLEKLYNDLLFMKS
jgi:hypothetical protein